METGIHNTSEIGRLKKVMLHRPGMELENLMPEYLERLLFDDIPYLKVAREEAEFFARFNSRTGENDSVYFLVAESFYRHCNRKIGFTGTCRSYPKYYCILLYIVDILLLT